MNPRPKLDSHGVPHCTGARCPHHTPKQRCALTGESVESTCQPAVRAMAAELRQEMAARSEIADSRLDLIFKIHQLAEEYVGERPIDAQPENDLEAIEDGIAGAQSERDEYRRERDAMVRVVAAADTIDAEIHGMGGTYGCSRDELHVALDALREFRNSIKEAPMPRP